MSTTGKGSHEARVEIQRRFAFPVACMVFALLAVPLAARPRRGGRAMGFIVSLLLRLRILPDVYCWRGSGEGRQSFAGAGYMGGKFYNGVGGAGIVAGHGTDSQLDAVFAMVREHIATGLRDGPKLCAAASAAKQSAGKLSTVSDCSMGAGAGKHVHGAGALPKPKRA